MHFPFNQTTKISSKIKNRNKKIKKECETMRTICIINHKGGVAKTTTAVNLAAGLSRKDRKVLLMDLDPQGNVDLSLGAKGTNDIYDAITGKIQIQQCIVTVAANFDIITSKETLAKAEYFLTTHSNPKMLIRTLLGSIKSYDYLLIDCPPSLGILNQCILAYCKEAIVPTSADFLGLNALKKMTTIITKINETYGNDLRITYVVPTLFDSRNKICKETVAEIKALFPTIATEPIRINAKLKEAPKYSKSIFSYAPSSSGAQDYGKLVDRVVAMEAIAIAEATAEKA